MRMLACRPCKQELCYAEVLLASSSGVLNPRTNPKNVLMLHEWFECLHLRVAPTLSTLQAQWLLYTPSPLQQVRAVGY